MDRTLAVIIATIVMLAALAWWTSPSDFYVTNGGTLTLMAPALTTSIRFNGDHGEVGRLDWSSGQLVFTGKADESARVFFDHVIKVYSERCRDGSGHISHRTSRLPKALED